MNRTTPALALAAALAWAAPLWAGDPDRRAPREAPSFGALRAPDAARAQALAWLQSAGKTGAPARKAFDAAWASDRPVLDKVADTLALGDADAARLLAEARDPEAAAPTEVPAVLKDPARPAYLRANLALAYGRALSNRKVFEESLEALKATRAEDVVDPAAYFFHKAVAAHALMQKKEADDTINRLLDDVADAPERYKMVAALMHFDMLTWQEKDLGWVARKMDNIQRRLDLARGGKKTQKLQKEVVQRLDEMIKELENQQKGNGCCSGGNGQNPNNNIRASGPQNDSNGGNGSGPGQVDPRKIKELADVWGKLPEKERAKAMLDLTRGMDPRYRDAIETYFKKLGASEAGR